MLQISLFLISLIRFLLLFKFLSFRLIVLFIKVIPLITTFDKYGKK